MLRKKLLIEFLWVIPKFVAFFEKMNFTNVSKLQTYLSLWMLLAELAIISSIKGSATIKEVRDDIIKSSLIVSTFMITAINKLFLLMTEM